MDERTGGKGVVFATGTPVSNSNPLCDSLRDNLTVDEQNYP